MRFVVYGIGAIGGVLAARLHCAGEQVVGIARGAQLAAMEANGLELRRPGLVEHARFPVFSGPEEIGFTGDDVVFLTMKGQDTEAALNRLRAVAPTGLPVFCFQNGVANERAALRHFARTYGVTVMMPATYTTPGMVAGFGTPNLGMFDIGCFPQGIDDTALEVCKRITAAQFHAVPRADVMASKYRKLLGNLNNIIGALTVDSDQAKPWYRLAAAEAEAALEAAGIACDPERDPEVRAAVMENGEIPGVERIGSSSLQSLVRDAGSIETDYLNGEIVLLARLHGLRAPVNAALCRLSLRVLAGDLKPRQVTDAQIAAAVDETGG